MFFSLGNRDWGKVRKDYEELGKTSIFLEELGMIRKSWQELKMLGRVGSGRDNLKKVTQIVLKGLQKIRKNCEGLRSVEKCWYFFLE